MLNYQRECPGCGQTFEAKRLNQKFCDSRCKARFHNHNNKAALMRKKAIELVSGNTNKVLWGNRELLKMHEGAEVDFREMEKIGFKRNYITYFEQTDQKTNRLYCYDMAYEFVDGKTIKIYSV